MSASVSSVAHTLGFDASDADTRALAIGVALSVLLHAAVLFLVPAMREGKPAAAPAIMLTARLASRAAAPEPPRVEPRPEPRLEPKVEPPRPVVTAPTPSPAAPRVAPPLPVPAAPSAPPVAPAPSASPATPSAPAPVAPPSAAPVPAAPVPRAAEAQAPLVQEGVDPGTLDRFRLEILAATRRYKRYPGQAMERGWQGRVEIRIVIGANGMTQSMVIKSSSGFQLLDETALDMVKKGRPLVQVPASLRGREFIVDVPVIFDLKSG